MDNGDQFLQVDLGRIEPVYAVNVAGTSGKYVTGYHLLYSLNGHKFLDVFNSDGEKEVWKFFFKYLFSQINSAVN